MCPAVQRSLPGFDKDRVKGPASAMWPGYAAAYPLIEQAIGMSVQAVRSVLHPPPNRRSDSTEAPQGMGLAPAQAQGPRACQVFGYDFLIDADCRPWLIEANAAPQLGHPQAMGSLRRSLALPMINGLAAVLSLSKERRTKGYGQWRHVPIGVSAAGAT